MSLNPLRDQILVLRDAAPEATASGIVLAPDATNITDQGIVMATGPDAEYLKVGDRVLFGKYTGQSHRGNPREIFVREGEVFAVVEDSALMDT